MSDFGETTHKAGRKDHCCHICYGVIPKGEVHYHFKGMWDGDWQDWRAHDECYDDTDTEEGFCPGDAPMPDRIRALYDEVDGRLHLRNAAA